MKSSKSNTKISVATKIFFEASVGSSVRFWLAGGTGPGSFGVRRLNGQSGALNLKLMGVV